MYKSFTHFQYLLHSLCSVKARVFGSSCERYCCTRQLQLGKYSRLFLPVGYVLWCFRPGGQVLSIFASWVGTLVFRASWLSTLVFCASWISTLVFSASWVNTHFFCCSCEPTFWTMAVEWVIGSFPALLTLSTRPCQLGKYLGLLQLFWHLILQNHASWVVPTQGLAVYLAPTRTCQFGRCTGLLQCFWHLLDHASYISTSIFCSSFDT